MKKIVVSLQGIVLALFLAVTSFQAVAADTGKIAPEVLTALSTLPAGQKLSVVVQLAKRADLRKFLKLGRKARRTGVIQALKTEASSGQTGIRALLKIRQTEGKVTQVSPLWITNGLLVTATADVIQELALRADVAGIALDAVKIVPMSIPPGPPEPNLSVIGTPQVWSQNFYGQGVVVANLDSGVDVSHPDLSAKWRGGTNSWYDPYGQHPTSPIDLTGHGTWTMGVMVGGDANGTSIGVAPQAQWIAAKIFKDNGTATATGIHLAFQWLLDPDSNPLTDDAPQVVNNSWAYGSPGCNLEFQPDLQALISSGIVPVFAAGNYGPTGNTSVSPANYPEAFAVGATDNYDQWYASSSAGPSACGEASTVYPELVAPGVNINTTDLFGIYTNPSGTSIAAPHVSGALALLLNAYPNLTAAQQEQALLNSAVDLGTLGADNIFGYGRLNLSAAYDFLVLNGGNPPPPLDTVGPRTSSASLSPTPNNGTLGFDVNTPAVRMSAVVNDPVSFGVQSNIAAAEAFIDSLGANGKGLQGVAADSAFNSPTEAVYVNISLTTVAQLGEGTHTLFIHGQDSAGNWGANISSSLVIDKTAPTISNIVTNPALSNGTTAITLTGVANDTVSKVVSAEWFTGNDPGAGNGTAMTVSGAGPYNLTANINVSTWSTGSYTLYVRAKDKAGNWGTAVSVSVAVDRTPPTISAVGASPNPSNGATLVALSAAAADTGSSVVAAEWFSGIDPGLGLGTPMTITGTGPWGLTSSINISTWALGSYTLSVRAKDSAGNWSTAVSTVLTIGLSNTLFTDGFESANLTVWNGGVTGSRLSVTTASALAGTYGMQATLGSNTAASYVTDLTPSNESSYHARFYLNPHGVLTGNGTIVTLFSGLNAANTTIFQLQYRINGTSASSPRQVRLLVQRSGGTTASSWFTITNNAAHPIEIAWQSATSASAGLYTDGVLRQTLTALNTSAYRLDTVRFGPSAGLVSTASGTLYFDAFASTRNTVIGP
jgi:subtilisin family serine protease